MKTMILSFVMLFSLSSLAQYTPRVDVNMGLQKVGDYVDVLIKTQGYAYAGSTTRFERLYILKFKAEGAGNSSGIGDNISSIGVEASLLQGDLIYDYSAEGGVHFGFSLLDYQYNKNIDINQGGTATLTVLGVRAGGAVSLNDENSMKLFVNTAASFGGILLNTERMDDGQGHTGLGRSGATTYDAELGLIVKKLKFSVGVRGQNIRSQGYDEYYGVQCDRYYGCYDVFGTEFSEHHRFRELFVKLVWKISPRFQVYGKVASRRYKVDDYYGVIDSSNDSATYLQVGAKYRFGGKKKRK